MEVKDLYKIFQNSTGVCTDTRQIKEGVLFFALKGNNFNGNEFSSTALDMGASYAVIDDEKFMTHPKCILVPDVLKTLQELANYHRRQFNIPFIAITGSNGKTTTKELINTVLSTTYKTCATKGNLNNHIGIPLTLLSISIGTEIAIIEMGANHQKEIESYCNYVEPSHGIITNIGKAHLDGFGGLEGVKKGKGELYDYILKNKGVAFINSGDKTLMEISKFPNPILYSSINNFSYCELITSTPFVSYKSENGEIVETNLTGSYNYNNIAAAICIGKYFDVPEPSINKAISAYNPDNNRSQFIKKGTNEILLDAYNANPSSMKVAIENFNKLNKKNKVIILGDMFELGTETEAEHKLVGEFLSQGNYNKIFLCGKNMKWASEKIPSGIYFETKTELSNYLQKNKINNSILLIKGSRGMGLETLLEVC